MKPTSTTAMPDISDEAPHLTQADFDRANFKLGDKAASKPEWQTAVRANSETGVRPQTPPALPMTAFHSFVGSAK